jgi:hypothetical protein
MDCLKILWEGFRPQIVGHVSIPKRYFYSVYRVYILPSQAYFTRMAAEVYRSKYKYSKRV